MKLLFAWDWYKKSRVKKVQFACKTSRLSYMQVAMFLSSAATHIQTKKLLVHVEHWPSKPSPVKQSTTVKENGISTHNSQEFHHQPVEDCFTSMNAVLLPIIVFLITIVKHAQTKRQTTPCKSGVKALFRHHNKTCTWHTYPMSP